jgi:archaellum component FlaF (FlaF/FlaG flagellin family)
MQKLKIWYLAIAITTINACQKDNLRSDFAGEDNALATQNYDDATELTDRAAIYGTLNLLAFTDKNGTINLPENCATITRDTTTTPKTIVIDFGNTNCTGDDGRNRRGKILVSYTGRCPNFITVVTIFDNYFVDDNQVLGKKTVTNNGKNASNQTNYNVLVEGEIRTPTLDTILWNSTRTRTWVAGEATTIRTDDVYEVTGSGTCSRKNGQNYTWQITTALRKALACRWIDTGIMTITPKNKATRTLNFGSGTCDNDAVITVGRITKNIKLR